jgi:caa(3)-type oxidase subunit IV
MDPTNENKLLNAILALAALTALVVAGYNVFTGQIFSTGVDGSVHDTSLPHACAHPGDQSAALVDQERGSEERAKPFNGRHGRRTQRPLFHPAEEDPAHAHEGASTRLNLIIWGWLLLITGIEVLLGYLQIAPPATMLLILMALSVIKAGLIMAYFMHLKFERMTLVLTVVPAIVICISLFGVFFPDSIRSLTLRAFH